MKMKCLNKNQCSEYTLRLVFLLPAEAPSVREEERENHAFAPACAGWEPIKQIGCFSRTQSFGGGSSPHGQ